MKVKTAKSTQDFLAIVTAIVALVLALNAFGAVGVTLSFAMLYGVVLLWIGGFLVFEGYAEGGVRSFPDIFAIIVGIAAVIMAFGNIITGFTIPILSDVMAQYSAWILALGAIMAFVEAFTE